MATTRWPWESRLLDMPYKLQLSPTLKIVTFYIAPVEQQHLDGVSHMLGHDVQKLGLVKGQESGVHWPRKQICTAPQRQRRDTQVPSRGFT